MDNRREFIKKSLVGAGSTMMLGSLPIRSFGSAVKGNYTNNRKLVIIQLHGGNDGLNFFPPAVGTPEREVYVYRRPRISLPSSGSRGTLSLGFGQPLSLHPDMIGLKQLWDKGKVAIVPGVSTSTSNASHFRGRDIRAMGGGFNDFYSSGWLARYLKHELGSHFDDYHEGFPNDTYQHPLALELGVITPSLPFHFGDKLPASIAVNSPDAFRDLVAGNTNTSEDTNENGILDTEDTNGNGVLDVGEDIAGDGELDTEDTNGNGILDTGGLVGIDDNIFEDNSLSGRVGYPPDALGEDDAQYKEYYSNMDWLINLESDADKYSEEIAKIYQDGLDKSGERATYPTTYPFEASQKKNPISEELEIIATLIKGGIDTKVFLVRIGGFDTHANQVESYDSTLGDHAAKAYHLSQALAAFQKDLGLIGCEEDVITITTTEFGRQIADNGFGTDHGNASFDLIVSGNTEIFNGVIEGGLDYAPTESELLNGNNLNFKVDYRRIYTTILKHWFEVESDLEIDKIIDPDNNQQDKKFWSTYYEDKLPYLDFLDGDSSAATVKKALFNEVQIGAPYPNPAIEKTTLELYLPISDSFTIAVYNRVGTLVRTVFSNKPLGQGSQIIEIELAGLPSGQYLIELSSGKMQKTTTILKL